MLVKLQTGLENALYFRLEHFHGITQTQTTLRYVAVDVLQQQSHLQREIAF